MKDKAEIRQVQDILRREEVDYWLGMFGYVTARKNLRLVARAVLANPQVGLLVAGTIDAESAESSRELLEELARQQRYVNLAGPLSDAQFDAAILEVDCVIAAHSNEGPSGVVGKAAVGGKRLILAGARSLRRDALALPAQAVWVALDDTELSAAIADARLLPTPNAGVRGGVTDFVRALL